MKAMKYLIIILLLLGAKNLYSSASVQTSCVDKYGKVWFANSNGVFVIDEKGKSILTNNTIKDASCIFIDSGLLYVGSHSGKLHFLNTNTNKVVKIYELKSGISNILKVKQNIVISTLGNGFFKLKSENIFHFNLYENNYLYDFCFSNNKIWCATDNGLKVLDTSFHLIDMAYNTPDVLITSLEVAENRIIGGTQNGRLFFVSNSRNLIGVSVKKFEESIENIFYSNGKLYFSSGRSVYVKKANEAEIKKIYTGAKINSIFHKHDGTIILGSSNGFVNVASDVYNVIPNTKTANAMVAISTNEIIYAENNICKLKSTNSNTSISLKTFFSSIQCFHKDINQNVWIGTLLDGLYKYSIANKTFQKIKLNAEIEKIGILSIATNSNEIYISTLNGVWHSQLNNIDFKVVDAIKNSKIFYVYNMLYDSKGKLWLATDGQGIYYIHQGEVIHLNDKRIDKITSYALVEDSVNNIWFSSNEKGLFCFSPEKLITQLNTDNGLQSNEIISIVVINNKLLGIATASGVQIINSQFNTFNVKLNNINAITNSICSTADGFCVGSDSGLVQMKIPDYVYDNEALIAITKIESLNDENICTEKTIFKYNENSFKIIFNANIPMNEEIYYRYKLEGSSNKWISTTENIIHLLDLKPNDYRLIIQASNNAIFFQPIQAEFKFTVKPPFYKRIWFLLLTTVAAVLLIRLYIKNRDERKAKIEKLEKEKVISQLEALKTQVSPHFLFNSLNALLYIIEDDKKLALEYTQKLSEFYRTLISFKNEDLISLQQELAMNEKYIYLQKIRFADLFSYSVNINSEQLNKIKIPPLTIQMLCENIFKHNAIDKQNKLNISISIQSNLIVVENNINKKLLADKGEGIGLKNIQNRYKLHVSKPVEIENDSKKFIVKLPIL